MCYDCVHFPVKKMIIINHSVCGNNNMKGPYYGLLIRRIIKHWSFAHLAICVWVWLESYTICPCSLPLYHNDFIFGWGKQKQIGYMKIYIADSQSSVHVLKNHRTMKSILKQKLICYAGFTLDVICGKFIANTLNEWIEKKNRFPQKGWT